MNPKLHSEAITSPSEIDTDRLLLKPIKREYLPLAAKYLGDYSVRHPMRLPTLDTREKLEQWWQNFEQMRQEGRAVQWCAFLKSNQEYAALLTIKEIEVENFRGELGYSVIKEFWNQGIAFEAARRVMKYAFEEIGLHSLLAQVLPDNPASLRIVEKLGMKEEAHFREAVGYKGQFFDLLQFSVINPCHL